MSEREIAENVVLGAVKAIQEATRGRTPSGDQDKAWVCRNVRDDEASRDYRICVRPGWNVAEVTDPQTGITYDVAVTERVHRGQLPRRIGSSRQLLPADDDCGCNRQ